MAEVLKCGKCSKFDRNNAVGEAISGDGKVGLCQAPLGLRFYQRTPDSLGPPVYQQYFVPINIIIFPGQQSS